MSNGFWRTVSEVKFPLRVDEEILGEGFSEYKFDFLARIRDKVVGKELKHYWVRCMNWINPICCEMANYTEELVETVEWEIEKFEDLKDLSRRVKEELEKLQN